MELKNENEIRFLAKCQVTEEKLLHMEKGVRKLGFRSGGNKLLGGLILFAILCFAIGAQFAGLAGIILKAAGGLLGLAFLAGAYSILKSWTDAKRQIHLQYEAGKQDMEYAWEYRFYEDCYEVLGKNEIARVRYSNLGRLLEFSGMLLLVERGNVVRYFMKKDVIKGNADDLVTFLERKSRTKLEFVSVR